MEYSAVITPLVGRASHPLRSSPKLQRQSQNHGQQPIQNNKSPLPISSSLQSSAPEVIGVSDTLPGSTENPILPLFASFDNSTEDPGPTANATHRVPSAGSLKKRGCPPSAEECGEATKKSRRDRNQKINDKGKGVVGNNQDLERDIYKDPSDTDNSKKAFACPFFRLDPFNYARCGFKSLRRISDVTQHLVRDHQSPNEPYCSICFEAFKEASERDSHTIHCTDKRPHEFFSQEDVKKIRGDLSASSKEIRKRFKGTAPATNDRSCLKWKLIWNLHFSDEDVTPYLDHPMVEAAKYLRHNNQVELENVVGTGDSDLKGIQDVAYCPNPPARPRWRPYRIDIDVDDEANEGDSTSQVAPAVAVLSPQLTAGEIRRDVQNSAAMESLGCSRADSSAGPSAQGASSPQADIGSASWGVLAQDNDVATLSPVGEASELPYGNFLSNIIPPTDYNELSQTPEHLQGQSPTRSLLDPYMLDFELNESLENYGAERPTPSEDYDMDWLLPNCFQ